MTKEQRADYQKFATHCMKNKTPVKFNTGRYTVKALIYRLRDKTDEELFTVELADLNGCDSLITVGLEEFYKENNF